MEVVNIEGFKVSGFLVRTKNTLEMETGLGKIPTLWDNFFKELAPQLKSESLVYGVYCNYESDDSGEFDVLAGSNALNIYDSTEDVQIEKGSYLVFRKEGEMPNAIIELWGEVWNFFKKSDCSYTREYKTDFEKYIGSSIVEVYIGIK